MYIKHPYTLQSNRKIGKKMCRFERKGNEMKSKQGRE